MGMASVPQALWARRWRLSRQTCRALVERRRCQRMGDRPLGRASRDRPSQPSV